MKQGIQPSLVRTYKVCGPGTLEPIPGCRGATAGGSLMAMLDHHGTHTHSHSGQFWQGSLSLWTPRGKTSVPKHGGKTRVPKPRFLADVFIQSYIRLRRKGQTTSSWRLRFLLKDPTVKSHYQPWDLNWRPSRQSPDPPSHAPQSSGGSSVIEPVRYRVKREPKRNPSSAGSQLGAFWSKLLIGRFPRSLSGKDSREVTCPAVPTAPAPLQVKVLAACLK